ncbi:hypothetical protein GCM10011512_08470 [Tersicoccus solisilvae]|uniref:Tetratrico peptide repeat group 5 domain-containing protein n=1 Tax=Tersicoccus solisilvae TaxID=1882339 RepID=A0ABQ1NS83_9MICC|nr:hypothetical protein [Tersicoccus solisilvae]GGC83994.1 hypothetical protein GCM10011512_08470 [Tersicoccus solisilvae]
MRAQLRTLESKNAEWVAKHLVMAGRYLDIDPALAFEHALAASRRGGRIGAVREAVGITAYEAGDFAEALREFRTFRRISGSNEYLALMADCERGLGRPQKAIELAASVDGSTLDAPTRVELAMVVSGAHADLGRSEESLTALEIPQLDINRAFSWSPRLFLAYADALDAAGRTGESERWRLQSERAEQALGVGDFAEPDIIDLGDDDEPEDRRGRDRRDDERADAGADTDADDTAPASDADAAEPAAGTEADDASSEDSAPQIDADTDDAAPASEADAAEPDAGTVAVAGSEVDAAEPGAGTEADADTDGTAPVSEADAAEPDAGTVADGASSEDAAPQADVDTDNAAPASDADAAEPDAGSTA